MKKVVLLMVFGLTAMISSAQEVKEYYESGKLKLIGNEVDNMREGEWKAYFENGDLAGVANYLNGEATGIWIEYHENGRISVTGSFLNDMQTGEWKEFHENGQLSNIGVYENDDLTGIWKSYYDNGELKSIITYVDGDENGWAEEYLPNGSPSKKGNNGENDINPFGGTLYGPVGNWTYWEYYSNGQLEKKYTKLIEKYTTNEIYNGDYEIYHENGQLDSKGKYVDDKKEGEWKTYFEDGTLYSSGNYSNGEKEGEWYQLLGGDSKYKILYENGEIIKDRQVNSQDDPLVDPYYKIRFKNSCEQEISLAVIFKNLDDEWETKGYYIFDSNDEIYVANTENRIIYYFAITTDNRYKWEGDHIDYLRGNEHSFREVTIPSDREYGNYNTNFSCAK